MGGFNDDWDLTAGVLEAVLSRLPLGPPLDATESVDLDALIDDLYAASAALRRSSVPHLDWQAWIEPVRSRGGGLAGLRALTGGHNAHFVLRSGTPRTTDLVQRIFSEFYLGPTLFEECYGFPARFVTGPGLIERERLLISRSTLEALASRYSLGIATGRTRFEAAQAFRAHALAPYFGAVATMTDAQEAQIEQQIAGHNALLKPHPYLLQLAADTLDAPSHGTAPQPAVYVGDSPDDISAARRADGSRRWLAVGLSPAGSALRDLQVQLGADRVIEDPDMLMRVL